MRAQEFPVVVENSYAMGNGYIHYGTSKPPNMNGNGFKMGYSRNDKGRHTIRNCVAWNNVASGFYANYTSVGSTWTNTLLTITATEPTPWRKSRIPVCGRGTRPRRIRIRNVEQFCGVIWFRRRIIFWNGTNHAAKDA